MLLDLSYVTNITMKNVKITISSKLVVKDIPLAPIVDERPDFELHKVTP